MKISENILGSVIRDKRKSEGLTLKSLSKKLGCSISYLSDVEKGNRIFSFWGKKQLKALESIGLTKEYIFIQHADDTGVLRIDLLMPKQKESVMTLLIDKLVLEKNG